MGNLSWTVIRDVAQSARPEQSASDNPPVVAANDQPTHGARETDLEVDKSADRLIVKVFDSQTTNELLAQLPSETMLAEARALALTIGALVDVEA